MIVILAGLIMIVAAIAAFILGSSGGEENFSRKEVEIRGVQISVDVRDTAVGRAEGLSGKKSLDEDSGMLFIFNSPGEYGFWMRDMNFPIDIIWIMDGKIAGISENLKPEPEKSILTLTVHKPPKPVDTVLEVPAGTSARHGWAVGDDVIARFK